VRANSYSLLEESVVLPRCQIGRGARLRRVILDHGVIIPAGLVVGEDPALDATRFRRTASGICLVTQAMLDKLS
jgi:glucose-1-phosphate adenylyltransferase